jgi:transposase
VPPQAATATGPNLTALAATLVGEYHLSRDATASLLGSVLGMPICAATVQRCCEAVSAALQPATAAVDAALPASSVVHMDETSWKQGKVLHWLWIAVGDAVTSFAIHGRRGAQQLEKWFPEGFEGVVNCDRWRPYERFARRQLCWSHLERDLQAIIDGERAGAEPATRALAGAAGMFATWHRFKSGQISRGELQHLTADFRARFKTFCTLGTRQKRDRKWRSLGRDLLRQWEAVFRFLDTEGIEPTNNTAERGLRGGVLWRRISQGSRTEAGSLFVQRIMTAAANCRRQARNLLPFLAESLLAHRQGIPTPSLLPATSSRLGSGQTGLNRYYPG